jgi:hypothetical protein
MMKKKITGKRQRSGHCAALTMVIVSAFAIYAQTDVSCNEPRLNISMSQIKAVNIPEQLAVSIQEQLESDMINYGRYNYVSRADMDAIMLEMKFSQTGMSESEEGLLKAGNMLGVDKIITGTISRVGRTYNVVLKLIEVKSARIEASSSRKIAGDADSLLYISKGMLQQLLKKDEPGNQAKASDQEKIITANPPRTDSIGKEVQYETEFTAMETDAPHLSGTSIDAKKAGRGAIILISAIAVIFLAYQFLSQ